MRAFDLDGVFIPDVDLESMCLTDALAFRGNLRPIFEPEGDYYIVTGRPVGDKEATEAWIAKYFKNPPKKLFHGCPDLHSAAKYKAEVIKENPEILVFIESDRAQVEYLREVHGEMILHWEESLSYFVGEYQ